MPKTNPSPSRKEGSSRSKRGTRQRRLSVRGELRAEPDIHKIARAVVALAIAQAEKEAAEEVARQHEEPTND